MPGAELRTTISGRHIELVNDGDSSVFPVGVIESGTLMWHARSRQWIVGSDQADAKAEEVGGCSDGPSVVDLVARIYWTC